MRSKLILTCGAVLCLFGTGCVVVTTGGCNHWGSEPRVWAEGTETLTVNTAGLETMVVRTHNGAVVVEGQPDGAPEAKVTVTKKGGGRTQAEAEEALAAIDVYAEPTGGGTAKIGWKWKVKKQRRWRAQVSFDITAPGHLRVDAETHNGSVNIDKVTGDVKAVTHNGGVEVDSSNGELYAETHNGQVVARYAGPEVRLVTHNGRVVADLERCAQVTGKITTHNGAIEVIVGENTSANLKCETHNGGISCDVPVTVENVSRRQLTGTLGTGGGTLDIKTHNGAIRIKRAEG